jgi:hypothetical protein
MNEEILATIPQESPESRLEVALVQDSAGSKTVEFRRLLWGEGIGWYRLHTIHMDRAAARMLLKTLRQAQNRWQKRVATARGKVISFPQGRKTKDRVESRTV